MMGKKLNVNDFIKYLRDNNAPIDYVSGYINTSTKCLVRCTICGNEYYSTPSNIKRGYFCRKCGIKSASKKLSTPLLVFNAYLKDNKIPIRYVSGYVNYGTSCNLTCLNCAYKWKARPQDIKKGERCPRCSRIKSNKVKEKPLYIFIERLQNSTLEYIGGYKNITTPCKVICRVCKYKQFRSPHDLSACNYRCPKCSLHRKQSMGEYYVENYLKNAKISYIYPKTFDDLRNTLPLHYDFYLPKENILIEYQGVQHYEPRDYFGGLKAYKRQLHNDDIKRQYAKDNGYKLIEIPYTVNTQEKINKYIEKVFEGSLNDR